MDKFKKIVSNDNFRRTFNNEDVRLEIIDILHKCIGLASGAVINTTSTLFSILHPTLNDFASLIGLFHNYQIIVHLIIQLFVEFSTKMLCFLGGVRINIFFKINLIYFYLPAVTISQVILSLKELDSFTPPCG